MGPKSMKDGDAAIDYAAIRMNNVQLLRVALFVTFTYLIFAIERQLQVARPVCEKTVAAALATGFIFYPSVALLALNMLFSDCLPKPKPIFFFLMSVMFELLLYMGSFCNDLLSVDFAINVLFWFYCCFHVYIRALIAMDSVNDVLVEKKIKRLNEEMEV